MKRLILGFLVLMGGLLGVGGVVVQDSNAASDTIAFAVSSDPGVAFSGHVNPSAVMLPNGNVRLYMGADATGFYESWTSSDGVHFTQEPGNRDAGMGVGSQAQVFEFPNGSYRMYFNNAISAAVQGIGSATSTDGLNFSLDSGLRITAAQAGIGPNLSPGSVVELPNGTYRMYFSSLNETSGGLGPYAIESATSSDGVNWTMDPGVRVGPGASALTGSAEHPSALVNPDGSISLFYGRRASNGGIMVSTSTDGLTFTSESQLLNTGEFGQLSTPLDSSVVRLPNGTVILYSSDRDNASGINYIRVRILTETITPAITPTTVPSTHKVTVAVTVKGSGLVTGRGISCPKTCKASLASGSSLSLRARPHRGYRFSGWSGPCHGTGVCRLHVTAMTKISATFRKN